MFVYSEPRSKIPTLSERVRSHPRSANSFFSLIPIPCLLSPNPEISPAALSTYPAFPLSLLQCAVPDKHRVLPVFSRNRPRLSPLECALPSPLVTTHSKRVTEVLTPLECALTKNPGGTPSSQISFSLSGFRTFRRVCELSPVFSNSCALFCSFLHSRKTQLFCFQAIPHSSLKNTRVGVGGAVV